MIMFNICRFSPLLTTLTSNPRTETQPFTEVISFTMKLHSKQAEPVVFSFLDSKKPGLNTMPLNSRVSDPSRWAQMTSHINTTTNMKQAPPTADGWCKVIITQRPGVFCAEGDTFSPNLFSAGFWELSVSLSLREWILSGLKILGLDLRILSLLLNCCVIKPKIVSSFMYWT